MDTQDKGKWLRMAEAMVKRWERGETNHVEVLPDADSWIDMQNMADTAYQEMDRAKKETQAVDYLRSLAKPEQDTLIADLMVNYLDSMGWWD